MTFFWKQGFLAHFCRFVHLRF